MMGFMCMYVLVSATQCSYWSDLATFLVVDVLLFIMRMVLLFRVCFNLAPKLFNKLLANQVENLPIPLPTSVRSLGMSSATRLVQAFFCFLELLSPLALLIYLLIQALVETATKDAFMAYYFPMRTLLVFVPVAISFVSQVLASYSRITKLSTFSAYIVGLSYGPSFVFFGIWNGGMINFAKVIMLNYSKGAKNTAGYINWGNSRGGGKSMWSHGSSTPILG